MRAYKTIRFEQFPNIGDIRGDGRASHVGRLPEQGGEFKGYFRNPRDKRAVRRYLKHVDRRNLDRLEREAE